jgi:hypothetical protein
MEFPEGMKKIPGKALLPVNSLNGSKHGAFDWNERASVALLEYGMRQSVIDPYLFFKWSNSNLIIVALYVEYIYEENLSFKPLTLNSGWLGLGMEDCKPATTPAAPGNKLQPAEESVPKDFHIAKQ